MVKDIEYYMSLPYKIETEKLRPADGGGFRMFMPELGSFVVQGDGETLDDAWAMLKEVQKEIIGLWLARGQEVPEPDSIKRYSGKIALRISPDLHKKLVSQAKQNNTSLNHYISQALEAYTSVEWLVKCFNEQAPYSCSMQKYTTPNKKSPVMRQEISVEEKGPIQWQNVA
ncbi:toxin-antitoxin system HicB family antitoxin [Pyramidobacter sp. SM-530-WT-4B]|uniref:Toxin-antitoxin system HicB family antitoxin n=1 Tax=Pyramidobacter porci TaxID=2605789 RepID=A0A6L5YBV1_9BACT|nr:toxin-antitoxin system HicB family antitoxin [Pyramidobacter porci]MST55022.1 toxin-antitoxin system HicB family antitoxin [Pyramidobacter porci]